VTDGVLGLETNMLGVGATSTWLTSIELASERYWRPLKIRTSVRIAGSLVQDRSVEVSKSEDMNVRVMNQLNQ